MDSILETLVPMPVGFRAFFIVILIGLVLGALIVLVERARPALTNGASWNDSPQARARIADDIGRHAAGLPAEFAYLADVEPSIREDIRYAGAHNFIGRAIDGYLAGECVLTQRAARTLKQVQAELSSHKLSLIVWDCYRPTRAVRDFLAWSKVPQDAPTKAEFFPSADKAQLIALGYIASRSAHSRGSTVDLAIVPDNACVPPIYDPFALRSPKG
jgi:D-alanyl-D-alanine dipeptidase